MTNICKTNICITNSYITYICISLNNERVIVSYMQFKMEVLPQLKEYVITTDLCPVQAIS